MSNKQTRRSISLEKRLHDVAIARAEALNKAASEYISELIRADLIIAGIEPPPYSHTGITYRHAGMAMSDSHTALPEVLSDVEHIKHTFAPPLESNVIPLPTQALVGEQELDGKAKYEQALAYTREMLSKGLVPKPRTGCQHCYKSFQPGEIPQQYKGQRVHGRCKREIARMPDQLMP